MLKHKLCFTKLKTLFKSKFTNKTKKLSASRFLPEYSDVIIIQNSLTFFNNDEGKCNLTPLNFTNYSHRRTNFELLKYFLFYSRHNMKIDKE